MQATSGHKKSPRDCGGRYIKKSPLDGLPSRGRESSGALLSRARRPGTIGEGRLDCRVRNGNGYDPLSRTAETNLSAVMEATSSSAEADGSGLHTQRELNR